VILARYDSTHRSRFVLFTSPVAVLEQGVQDTTETERWLNDVGDELAHCGQIVFTAKYVRQSSLCSVTVTGSMVTKSEETSYDLPSEH
jgi:hypothetical protein